VSTLRGAAAQAHHKINRRGFITGAAAIGISAYEASLGLANTGLVAAAGSSRSADAAAMQTLVVAAYDTPQNLDTQKTVHLPSVEVVTGNLYDTLIQFKKKTNAQGLSEADFSGFVPLLAERWSVSPDGKTWTFHLRKGVMSAAGNELTANDVKWTWDRIYAVKGLGIFYYNTLKLRGPQAITVKDRYTVAFHTDTPSSTFWDDQQQFATVIIDSTEAKKHATQADPWATGWLAHHAAGFGPYVVSSWVPGQQMVLTARASYYRGPARIKQVIYKAVPDASSRLALLINGAADVAEDLSAQQLAIVRTAAGVKDNWWPGGSRIVGVEMNLAMKPFNDVRVRRAVSYATPYDAILSTVYLGKAARMKTIYPSSYPYATAQFNHYTLDYARAKSLLQQAGYPHGFTTTLSYNSGIPEEELIAVQMRSSLATVGINALLDKQPPAIFTQKLQQKKFPFVIYPDQPIAPDPGYAVYLYYVTGSLVNYTNYSSKEVDKLTFEGLATLDPAKQRRIWTRVQQLITADAPWVWLAEPGFHLATRRNVHGATWYPINLIQFYDFYKA
jgi:peptide/nickel transport system substrate-binding protein